MIKNQMNNNQMIKNLNKRLFLMSLCLLIAFMILIVPVMSVNAESVKLSNYLQDNAKIFSQSEAQVIEEALRNFQTETSVQFVIFTTNKIPDTHTLEEYTLKIAEDNKVGKKGLDTGLLFFLSIEDRMYRWETGYGLEGVLSAIWLGRMSRNIIEPYFKEGNFNYGIAAGMGEVMKKIKDTDDSNILPEAIRPPPRSSQNNSFIWIWVLFFVVFFVLPFFRALKESKNKGKTGKRGKHDKDDDSVLKTAVYLAAASALFGRRGGGFGGGGFGGFGGGGGGFGGGGFSGRF